MTSQIWSGEPGCHGERHLSRAIHLFPLVACMLCNTSRWAGWEGFAGIALQHAMNSEAKVRDLGGCYGAGCSAFIQLTY